MNLEVVPGWTGEKEKTVRQLIDQYEPEGYPAHGAWDVLKQSSEVFDLFGVEGVSVPDGAVRPHFLLFYVNTGETYQPTLCYDIDQGFMVTSWGAWLEEKEMEYERVKDD